MTTWLLAVAAGWSVLRWFGADRRWPWRVGALVTGTSRPERRRRTRGSIGRGAIDRRDRTGSAADVATVADLLHVAVSAGHSLHGAIAAVAGTSSGRAGAALARVDAAFGRGRRMIDALDELHASLGAEARPLVTALASSLRSGAPLAPALQRLADAERRRQRRRAEERVRRLPVLLLVPLVGLVLPAFVVLTIVPVALTTARTGLSPVLGLSAPAPDHLRSPP
jgi:type II secretory pathway component PulF